MAESVVWVHRISISEADRGDTSKAGTAKHPQSADAMEPDHLKWTFHETTVVRHRLQNAFGGRNMVGCAGIDFHRRAQRRFEFDPLKLAVGSRQQLVDGAEHVVYEVRQELKKRSCVSRVPDDVHEKWRSCAWSRPRSSGTRSATPSRALGAPRRTGTVSKSGRCS